MPVVAYSLAPSQCPSCAVLVLVFFRFASAAQVILVLIFFQKPIRSWKLIADVVHLLFSHVPLLQLTFILRPFARSGLSPLPVMAAHGSHHVDLECQVLALGSESRQLHHVSLLEGVGVN